MSTVEIRLTSITFLIDVVSELNGCDIIAPHQRFFQVTEDGTPDWSDVLEESEAFLEQLNIKDFELFSPDPDKDRVWIPYRFQHEGQPCCVRVYRPLGHPK